MWQYKNIIKGNYLQYLRSYSFLFVIAISLYVSFSFIPGPEANYTTIRFGIYSGAYNATWIGLATAILSSVFLSFFGFFLINGTIKKDIETRIGAIIGTSSISNFQYLFAKALANFLLLLSILFIIFLMSILLFFLYGKGFQFNFTAFIRPYLLISIPSLFFIAIFSLILEVLIPRQSILQYVIFAAGFVYILFSSSNVKNTSLFDVLGIQEPIEKVSDQVSKGNPEAENKITIGFVKGGSDVHKRITLEKVSFSYSFILQRISWIIIGVMLLYVSSFFFHRFNLKEKQQNMEEEKESIDAFHQKSASFQFTNDEIEVQESFGIFSLIKIELALLSRKNNKALTIATVIGMASMFFLDIHIAHTYVLPLLWFLQVMVWSDIETKDETNRTFFFTTSSYKPLYRLFISRIIAGFFWALLIASPLLVRLLFKIDFIAIINILLGGIFIVLLAVFLGLVTKSKKLFEIVFFFIIYCNLNQIAEIDYFGALHNSLAYTGILTSLIGILFIVSYIRKKHYVR